MAGQGPPGDLPQVAIAGRSNCGKSSLINAVMGRKKLARVSQTPGKTREINFFEVNGEFFVVDLPGYGYARAPEELRERWPTLIDVFLSDNPRLAGVVVLMDSRRGVLPADQRLLSFLADQETPVLYVLTKIDKLNRAGQRDAVDAVRRDLAAPADQVLATSARTREGLETLIESIFALVTPEPAEEP
ncbi:MAG: ribosome biogenesis GTP-binding protein YihA/YsxC [Gemmatimonadetes bacterium]|nr:ribosome biogenesis GTP-binding protein YihA/YsxC [Gemmatimonadota bacterium]